MRRYQKWLTVGLLALAAPGMVLAGPTAKPATKARAQSAASSKSSNQELANRVSQALEGSQIEIRGGEVEFQNGTAVVKGQVNSEAEKRAAEAVVRRVAGVQHVQNGLKVSGRSGSAVQQAAGSQSRGAGRQVRQVQNEVYEGAEPVQTPALPPAPGGVPMGAPGQLPPAAGPAYGGAPYVAPYGGGGAPAVGGPAAMPAYGAPEYGGPMAAGSNVIYNQPGLPNHAWPTYAQYPNYAAVSYPSQYSASAWPYIGPFYPYPQVPLGWRKAQLEWDDGYWHLNFSPRTERWWWFLDWRNW